MTSSRRARMFVGIVAGTVWSLSALHAQHRHAPPSEAAKDVGSAGARGGGPPRVDQTAEREQLQREMEGQREQMIMQVAGFDDWRQSQRLTGAPTVDKSLLSNPELVTRELRSYGTVVLDRTECGRLAIGWRHLTASDGPLPDKLPEERRAWLEEKTKHLSPQERQHRFERELERYQRSVAVVKGDLEVSIVVAPSSRAAQEFLVYERTGGGESALPIEARARAFDESYRMAGLGDVGFSFSGLVRFVRNNVVVIVVGSGDWLAEAEQLARKIDAGIVKQPVLKSLQAGRPSLAAGSLRAKSATYPSQPGYSFTATAPEGSSIAAVRAWVNGQEVPAKNQEVLLGSSRGKLTVKISAVTDALLATSIEKTVFVKQEPPKVYRSERAVTPVWKIPSKKKPGEKKTGE